MITLFIAQTQANADCVTQLRQDFKACGYTIWQEPASIFKLATSRRTIENAILSSAAVVVLWSAYAAQEESVEKDIHFAQTLKKLIFPITVDATPLPASLISLPATSCQSSCEKAVATLTTLPNFPSLNNTDPLIKLYEWAGSRNIRERGVAIDKAFEMHQKGERPEETLALLWYIARADTMAALKEKARKAFNNSDDPRHFFEKRCEKGHVSKFDKRTVCKASKDIYRTQNANTDELDELLLECQDSECNLKVVAFVDCQNYMDTR